MDQFMELTQQVLSEEHTIRYGYSESNQASYVIAQDIKGAMNYTHSTSMFLKGLERSQRAIDAGQAKGSNNSSPLYVGSETVQTDGGPQRMKVVYKRGVFQLLMTSRSSEAIRFKDHIFDILEQIERDGFYIKQNATAEQLAEAEAQIASLKDDLEIEQMSAEAEPIRNRKAFLDGVRAGRANPDITYGLSERFTDWEQG